MRLNKRAFFGILIIVVITATSSWGVMDPPVVDPPNPQAGDYIIMSVSGAAENTCYYLDGYTFDRVGDTFFVHIQNHYYGTACFFVYIPWGYQFDIGTLEPGTYYYDTWETVGDSYTGSFTVADCDPCLSGDVNGSTQVNVSDLTVMVDYLFRGGTLSCPNAADVDGNGSVNVSDLSYLVSFLMRGGPPPVPC